MAYAVFFHLESGFLGFTYFFMSEFHKLPKRIIYRAHANVYD